MKVTFNSALAQKEAKKDEPKSSEEALIIPPDAIAVDCKVRGPGRPGVWALGRAGIAARGRCGCKRRSGAAAGCGARVLESAQLFLFLGRLTFLVRPQLLCKKVRVQEAVRNAGSGAWEAWREKN